MTDLALPCSWCASEPATERPVGWQLSGGRMYPVTLRLCDPCAAADRAEKERSQRS